MKRKNILKFISLLGVGSFVSLAAASCKQPVAEKPTKPTEPKNPNNGGNTTPEKSGTDNPVTSPAGGSDTTNPTTPANSKAEVEKFVKTLTPESFKLVKDDGNDQPLNEIEASKVKVENFKLKNTSPAIEGWQLEVKLVSNISSSQDQDNIQIKVEFTKGSDLVVSDPITLSGFKTLSRTIASLLLKDETVSGSDGTSTVAKVLDLGDANWDTLEDLIVTRETTSAEVTPPESSSESAPSEASAKTSIKLVDSGSGNAQPSEETSNEENSISTESDNSSAIGDNSKLSTMLLKNKVDAIDKIKNPQLSIKGNLIFESVTKENDSPKIVFSAKKGEKLKIVGTASEKEVDTPKMIDIQFDKIVLKKLTPSDIKFEVFKDSFKSQNNFEDYKKGDQVSDSGKDIPNFGSDNGDKIAVPSKYTKFDENKLSLKIKEKDWEFTPISVVFNGSDKIENYKTLVQISFGKLWTTTNVYEYNVYLKRMLSEDYEGNSNESASRASLAYIKTEVFARVNQWRNNINKFLDVEPNITNNLSSWYSLSAPGDMNKKWDNNKNQVGEGNIINKSIDSTSSSNQSWRSDFYANKNNNFMFIAGIKLSDKDKYVFLPKITFVTFKYQAPSPTTSTMAAASQS
ncbi:hypothetical protein [Mycoplasma bradburyae]|uniref:Lipoprotein-associated type-17 domain-containing protein n=1 Tax=Mycoplasma bradburyae TaxID=2963128 RepID=A0ABT5GC45_9MOLU|nr:hypothetical protein [Mycoplasma bradburyae]MDC4182101.1 hypothetical protein [Mycoplasma bradburyae]UTS69825.1 hypothetical protein NMG68_02245 [Mycoplasma bradburyae]